MIVLVGSVICALIGTTLGSLAAHVGGYEDSQENATLRVHQLQVQPAPRQGVGAGC